MAHEHSRETPNYNRAFAAGVALNLAFVVVEVVFGYAAGSLALLADAGHNLSDVLGLLLAWGGSYLATRQPTARRTYGLRRSSILAALLNAMLLLMAVGAIAWEAVERFLQPASVASGTVMAVAGLGVVINTLTALLFHSGHQHDLNLRGAYLHMAADAAVSLGVVLAGGIIAMTGWSWLDPLMSLIIAAVIAIGTWDLLRQSIDLSLDAVPAGIDPGEVRNFLAQLPGVVEVHDLHIWAMSTTETALTVHLIRPNSRIDDEWLATIGQELHDRFGIEHTTIQVESVPGCLSCRLSGVRHAHSHNHNHSHSH